MPTPDRSARVLVTGSTQGLGAEAARQLLEAGHEVLVHGRTRERLASARELLAAGATAVVGDLADLRQVRALADQVADAGQVDAIVHNAGVLSGPDLAAVNVIAPYALTVLLPDTPRHVYLSSGMHRGRPTVPDPLTARPSYSDSKLLVTTLAFALARTRPAGRFNAVDPGWVPTRMGGRSAPDDLQLGAATQAWLATSDDPAADVSGTYWFHRGQQSPHPAARDPRFQDRLLAALADTLE